jgi:acyl transferase domain-containing protein
VDNGKARSAAVSSFGFGGINYHCVISEMTESYNMVRRSSLFKSGLNDRRIVIAGMGVMLPEISGSEELKKALKTGRKNFEKIPPSRFNNDYYFNGNDETYSLPRIEAGLLDDSFIEEGNYRMPPATLRSVDRCQFIGLECTKQILEQSKQIDSIQKGNNIAIIVGTGNGEKMIENIVRTRLTLIEKIISETALSDKTKSAVISAELIKSLKERYNLNNEDTVPGLLSNIVSGRIANFFGFNGANYVINSGDSSSAAAIRLAYLGILSGEYESVITGGVDSNITPSTFIALKQRRSVNYRTNASQVTDQDVLRLSEGGALFMLTTYDNALKKGMPVLAVVDNSASNINISSPAAGSFQKKDNPFYSINLKPDHVLTGSKTETGYYSYAEDAVSLAEQLVVLENRKSSGSTDTRPVFMSSEKSSVDNVGYYDHKNYFHGDKFTNLEGSLVTLLLSGQGAQRSLMMKELYDKNKIVRDTLDTGEAVFKNERGYSILDIMFSDSPDINLTENTQPAVFISSIAVFNNFAEKGFNPRYYIGHSLGECSALYCSGMLGFEDTMKLILKRSSLMKEAGEKMPGEMVALFKGWEESSRYIEKSGVKDVYVANRNSDAQSIIAGKKEGIAEFIQYMKKENLIFKRLALSGAFHTPLFNEASEELRAYLENVKFNEADYTRIISNVTAKPYPQDEIAVKDILSRQLISPVLFIDSVKYACAAAPYFIEAGPTGILTGLLKNINCDIKKAVSSVEHKKGETATLNEAIKIIHEGKKSEKVNQVTEVKSGGFTVRYRKMTRDSENSLKLTGMIWNVSCLKNTVNTR